MLAQRILITVGLAFGVSGSLLVAVEAVKLENIRRLELWLATWGKPTFEDVDSAEKRHYPGVRLARGFLRAFSVVAGAITLGICLLFDASVVVAVLVTVGVTAAAAVLVSVSIRPAIRFLSWLLESTPDGTVGGFGAACLVLGFAIELVVTWS